MTKTLAYTKANQPIDIRVIFKGKSKKRGSLVTLDVDNEHYESGRLDASNNNKWACNLWVFASSSLLGTHSSGFSYLSSQAKVTITLRADNWIPGFVKGRSMTVVIDLSQAKDGEELEVTGKEFGFFLLSAALLICFYRLESGHYFLFII